MSKIKKILNIIFEKEEDYTSTPKKLNKKKETKKTSNYITATEIAKHFNVKASEINNIFSILKWAIKEDKWWIATSKGLELGAKQEYNAKSKIKYIKWNENIKENYQLIQEINEFKKKKQIKKYSNIEKGYLYEEYITEHYRKLGYFVWEHGKEKGRLDQGIDLIVKKDKEIIFIQCKNWKQNTKFKIDHVRVKASRAEARQFMLNNPLFKGYDNKFRYTLSNDCMHPSAIKYIQETNGLFDYEIIEMN